MKVNTCRLTGAPSKIPYFAQKIPLNMRAMKDYFIVKVRKGRMGIVPVVPSFRNILMVMKLVKNMIIVNMVANISIGVIFLKSFLRSVLRCSTQ